MKRLTGAEILWDCLVREGVTDVFGYPGGAILPAYDAMLKYPIRHVLVRHEQGATHMADGYARASGKVGVAVATSGPGATNMVTGIATAMMDSSPIVCITGQVGSRLIGSDAFQETDITGITLPITKHNYLVTRADEVAPAVREAFQVAQVRPSRPGAHRHHEGRAADVVRIRLGRAAPAPLPPRPVRPLDPDKMRQALELIGAAKRPLDSRRPRHHARRSHRGVCARSSTRRGIPVAVTLLGIGGFPASHPLNLGMMGMHGEAWVNTAIQEADLLIALGMRFDDRVTGNLKTYALNAKKIHVDIDAGGNRQERTRRRRHRRRRRVDVLRAWQPSLPKLDLGEWMDRIDALKGDSAVRDIQNLPDDGHLYAAHVIHDLWRATDGQAIVVTDVGQHQMWEAQYYQHEEPRTLITSGGLGTMGFALPAAIGAKMACPDAEVWAVVGDGGFQMTMAELATSVQENLEVNVAIINNGYLGMVRQWQEFFYERRYAATPLLSPDFAKVAGAYGIEGVHDSLAQGRDSGRQDRARASGPGRDRLSGGAGRFGVPDGARRRGSAQDDSPADAAGGNRSR